MMIFQIPGLTFILKAPSLLVTSVESVPWTAQIFLILLSCITTPFMEEERVNFIAWRLEIIKTIKHNCTNVDFITVVFLLIIRQSVTAFLKKDGKQICGREISCNQPAIFNFYAK